MMTLDDISADEWTVVAVRIRSSTDQDDWQWYLSEADREALVLAREADRIRTTQVRGPEGRFRLLARRMRFGPRRVSPVVLEVGRGLFET